MAPRCISRRGSRNSRIAALALACAHACAWLIWFAGGFSPSPRTTAIFGFVVVLVLVLVAVVVAAAARMQLQVAREQIATAKEHAAYIARMLSSLGVILAVSIKRPLAFEVFRALGT